LLHLSPHYFYRTSANQGLKHSDFLEFEFERNVRSREYIVEDLVVKHLNSQQTVVDYGCGPGFLARWAAPHVRRLVACDISAGVLACAQVLNATANAEFAEIGPTGTIPLPDNSVDLVYSFAVIMHVTDGVFASILKEWLRVLRPGGDVVCHIAVDLPEWKSETQWRSDRSLRGRLKWRFGLHGFNRTVEGVRAAIVSAGFSSPETTKIGELGVRFDDDIARQHLWTFRKPGL
jgi:SAM-dependent methyltransferase